MKQKLRLERKSKKVALKLTSKGKKTGLLLTKKNYQVVKGTAE